MEMTTERKRGLLGWGTDVVVAGLWVLELRKPLEQRSSVLVSGLDSTIGVVDKVDVLRGMVTIDTNSRRVTVRATRVDDGDYLRRSGLV